METKTEFLLRILKDTFVDEVVVGEVLVPAGAPVTRVNNFYIVKSNFLLDLKKKHQLKHNIQNFACVVLPSNVKEK